jgi:alanine racemase
MTATTREHALERAVARVDLRAVERNCARLRALLRGGAELCAVVKADGYGHGALPCAAAALAGGADRLAVATAAEAVDLREGGVAARLLVMGALTEAEAAKAVAADAEVVAWREDFVRRLPAGARVHVKLDSGMGRLGTKDVEEARAVALVAGDSLAGVMTHFATADELDDEHFPAQLQAFEAFVEEMRAAHPDATVHAANSAAAFRDPAAHFDMVRCGIAVYGLDPFGEGPQSRGLEAALTLESYVAAVKRFEPGESAGYGRSWAATEPTWVGVLPIGYGDGWRRALSNNCDVLVDGRRRPVVGTISMDNLTVDLGPDAAVEPGEPAVLIGAQGGERILCEEVARRIDTINYEITCGLAPRVRRAHVR